MSRGRKHELQEELRKAELISQRLEDLRKLRDSYPEYHSMRLAIEPMHVDAVLQRVDEEIAQLRQSLGSDT
jgi:hypothetical protein